MGTSTYLPRLAGVKTRSSASQVLATTPTLTTITWSSTEYDVGNMWTSGTNVNIVQSGIYHIIAQVDFSASGAGNYRQVNISSVDGGFLKTEVTAAGQPDFRMISQAKWAGTLLKGDVITASVTQNTGGNLTNADISSFLIVQQIRGL